MIVRRDKMKLCKCVNGHFYDPERFEKCPHCGMPALDDQDDQIEDQFDIEDTLRIDDIEKEFSRKHIMSNPSVKIILKNIAFAVTRWFVQTVFFSLLPFVFYYLIRWMFQLEDNFEKQYMSELCTFTLMMSLSIILELSKSIYKNSITKEIVFPVCLILSNVFLIIYSTVLLCFQLQIPLDPIVFNKIRVTVLLISGIHFGLALLLQIVGACMQTIKDCEE